MDETTNEPAEGLEIEAPSVDGPSAVPEVEAWADPGSASEQAAADAELSAADGAQDSGGEVPEADEALARVNRVLLRVVIAVVVVLLAGLGVVLWQVLSPSDAPRSAAEQELYNALGHVQARPNDAQARVEYASALYRNGDAEAAVRELEAALKLRKDYPPALYNLAIIRWYSGQQDQAIKDLQRLVKVSPGDQEAWFRLGAFFEERDEADKAADAFRHAVEIVPGDVAARVRLGRALAKKGRTEEARAQFEAALQYVPDYKPALEALDALGR